MEDCSIALDSYRTPENPSFEENVKGVIAKASNVMLMVVHHDIRTESMHESMSSPFANNFGHWIRMKTGGNFSVTTTVGFEVQEHPLVQNCKLITPAMGNISHDNEKGFERRQTTRLRSIRGIRTLHDAPHLKTTHRLQFSPSTTTTSAMSVPMVTAEHLKPNTLSLTAP